MQSTAAIVHRCRSAAPPAEVVRRRKAAKATYGRLRQQGTTPRHAAGQAWGTTHLRVRCRASAAGCGAPSCSRWSAARPASAADAQRTHFALQHSHQGDPDLHLQEERQVRSRGDGEDQLAPARLAPGRSHHHGPGADRPALGDPQRAGLRRSRSTSSRAIARATTNEMLRRTVGGQASQSRHILGKAADVHFPDVPREACCATRR